MRHNALKQQWLSMCTDEAGLVNRSDTNLAHEPRQPQVCPESGCCETAETLFQPC